MKDFSKERKTKAKLPENEKIVGGDDRKFANDRTKEFDKLFKGITKKKKGASKNDKK